MRFLRVLAVLSLLGLGGCRPFFTRDHIHEEHRFPSGELLTCESWEEEGFQSRVGRTMQCWIEEPGKWLKEDLGGETWLFQGETQPDGPNRLRASRRLELHRSGAFIAVLMDNALLYKRPDLRNPGNPWYTFHIYEDQLTKLFLRAMASAHDPATTAAKKTAQERWKKVSPLDRGEPGDPWNQYEIASVEVPALRVVAGLRPPPTRASALPAKLVFLPKKLWNHISLSVEETLQANPGLRIAKFPDDVVFEVKAAEVVDGKLRILRREILEPSSQPQTLRQEFPQSSGSLGSLTVTFKPAFRFGDAYVTYLYSYGLPDADPVEMQLGEWLFGGASSWDRQQHRWGTLFYRVTRRGNESASDEVPVLNYPYFPPWVK